MRINDILKKEVLDENIKILGKVEDIIVDPDTLEITDFVFKRSTFSSGEDVVPVDMIKVIGDKIILKSL